MTPFGAIRETREAVRRGECSAVEACEHALARIEKLEPRLHAFTTVTRDRAIERARTIDRARSEWADRPLAGVPVAIKDVLCTKGVRTTASSRILEAFVPPFDATAVARLERAGAVMVGKTNCDEFAMGSSTENSAYGPTRNPWDTDRIPGGSSGGSAVAVAAGEATFALGTDTGGSIRQPAALCGVVGLKPTYGRVSRYGLLAFGSSLDHVGPLTRSVEDAAIVLSVIAGADPADATSASEPVPDFAAALTGDIRGVRIGVPAGLVETGIDPEIAAAFRAGLDVLAARGASLVPIELPNAGSAIPVYYLVATAEASSNLARYDGVRFGLRVKDGDDDLIKMYGRTREQGFGPEVKRRIMLGTYVLSAGYYDAYYLKAQQVRTLIRQDYERAFERVDAVVMPTTPTPAFKIGERVDDPLQMYLGDVFTVSANLAGLPAVDVPCGFTKSGLPIGWQFIGRMFDESTILRIAHAYERDTDWRREPPL
jgi:aspartyl-tRNA(Asn)/glutamyl-tRNA(Gln) amidotransferase subunit A